MLMLDICVKARKQEIYIPWILQLHCPAGYEIFYTDNRNLNLLSDLKIQII